jgi:hypothetical protein
LNRAAWVAAYAVAMAVVEAAVVVYLRALAPAAGPLAALQTALPQRILAIEVVREAATLVMLLAVAFLAGRSGWQRFLYFALAFGVWDLFYYIGLRVFIGWPPSLLTWDVLFLIPVPWIAPVLAPMVVSVGLIAGALWLLARQALDGQSGLPWTSWAIALAGAALILLSFTLDSRDVLLHGDPPDFRWGLFAGGVGLGVIGLVVGVRKGRLSVS